MKPGDARWDSVALHCMEEHLSSSKQGYLNLGSFLPCCVTGLKVQALVGGALDCGLLE